MDILEDSEIQNNPSKKMWTWMYSQVWGGIL